MFVNCAVKDGNDYWKLSKKLFPDFALIEAI